MKTILIDHDDSFTFNLRDWLSPAFSQIEVVNHGDLEKIKNFKAELLVLSPGPKNPGDYLHVLKFIENLPSNQPLLGVCLGMQMMAKVSGSFVKTYTPPLHGKKSKLVVKDSDFENFNGLEVARYHSLCCDFSSTSDFNILAKSDLDQKAMWIQHKQKKWMGFQFHPESFLTEKSFIYLDVVKKWCQS